MLYTYLRCASRPGCLKNSAESVDSLFCKRATGVPMTLGAPRMGIGHGGIEAILLRSSDDLFF